VKPVPVTIGSSNFKKINKKSGVKPVPVTIGSSNFQKIKKIRCETGSSHYRECEFEKVSKTSVKPVREIIGSVDFLKKNLEKMV
jgi:hypothetical protein